MELKEFFKQTLPKPFPKKKIPKIPQKTNKGSRFLLPLSYGTTRSADVQSVPIIKINLL